jgi:hypothetical protein
MRLNVQEAPRRLGCVRIGAARPLGSLHAFPSCKLGRISHGGKLLKFIIRASTPDGHIAYQTRSAEAALERARALAGEEAQDIHLSDMHGRVYEPDVFDRCFVRAKAASLPASE